MAAPEPHAEASLLGLWLQAGGGSDEYDPALYAEWLHEAGLILRPGDDGYEDAPAGLPCGWPLGTSRADGDHPCRT